MKKILFTLTLCITALTTPLFAASEEFEDEEGVQYKTLSASEVAVIGYAGKQHNVHIVSPVIGGSKNLEYDVVYIEKNAFKNNQVIETIDLPASIDSILPSAFEGCKMLYRVHFEEGSILHEIKDRAFANCTGLIDINIPARRELDNQEYVTYPYIRGSGSSFNTFLNVPNITYNLTFSDEKYAPKGYSTNWGAKGKNRPVEGYFVYANEAKTIIARCSSAAKGAIVVPDKVTEIQSSSVGGFSDCIHVTSIVLPASVATCGSCCFSNCSGLQSIFSKRTTPPNVNHMESVPSFYAFIGVDKSIPVYVPETSISAYSTAKGWDQFSNWKSWSQEEEDKTFKYNVTLNVNDATMGTVKGAGTFNGGSDVEIEASANAGFKFLHWSDNEKDIKRTIKLSSDTTITAIFADKASTQLTLTLLVNDSKMGAVTGGGLYDEGATANIAAVALEGYVFKNWSDGDKNAIRAIEMKTDLTLTAYFGLPTFKVTLAVNDAAMGTVKGAGDYAQGSTATIKAEPKAGFQFVKWSDENQEAIREITVDKDINLTAFFEALPAVTFTITVSSNDTTMGKVFGGGVYGQGAPVTLKAIPNEGFVFAGWNDGNKDNPRVFQATADAAFVATFEPKSQGIDQVQSDKAQGTKVIENGVLYILYNGTKYNVQGARIEN